MADPPLPAGHPLQDQFIMETTTLLMRMVSAYDLGATLELHLPARNDHITIDLDEHGQLRQERLPLSASAQAGGHDPGAKRPRTHHRGAPPGAAAAAGDGGLPLGGGGGGLPPSSFGGGEAMQLPPSSFDPAGPQQRLLEDRRAPLPAPAPPAPPVNLPPSAGLPPSALASRPKRPPQAAPPPQPAPAAAGYRPERPPPRQEGVLRRVLPSTPTVPLDLPPASLPSASLPSSASFQQQQLQQNARAAAAGQDMGALFLNGTLDSSYAQDAAIVDLVGRYGLSEKCQLALAGLPPQHARVVMQSSLEGARNPSSVVLSRCTQAASWPPDAVYTCPPGGRWGVHTVV
eukprot:TRINITY_DN50302_c0_g1_i1.p1 TRINITY_DN50302_c0_g1~~TRINITY_DN50302_c0_g1_i1.p1  ORF type:complete len:378 (+),score=70.19 TRINITY_DN50302_c0_g1_i1:101-1135(+)